ncbi:hypothetical protein MKZ38_006927 [Zalerion maritima]|uniref:Uncharacterized protein n=1 Tax=Zalerion maritima TaxID=339359 RepID=A0AAD5RVA5_9PEZI|nr:hypothetical protein MKZ38_006927 [Zalerion maritima]
MANQSQAQIIQSNPTGEGISVVHKSFELICCRLEVTSRVEELSKIDGEAYDAVTESTPPPPRSVRSLQQTPRLRNTSSFVNSSEHRKYVYNFLKEELGPMYVGVPGFYEAYFGNIAGLEPAAVGVFEKCQGGDSPLYQGV